ncbi:MAG: exonuclease domain-containing protein [Oscillospiraceae bacterium]|nr:exonuclease domain-containing protein [Oscillospiraceae bacterium]
MLDLEWNLVYSAKIRGYINEIIEIGAVMLDERFCQVSTFSVLVKSSIGRRLQNHVREMTNISHKDLANGTPFPEAAAQFRNWIGEREHVMLSWGDGDLRVLLANTRYHISSQALNYIQNYVDLQDYFGHRMHTSRAQQIGLAAAGELLGFNVADYTLHRALDDSLFAAECFKAIFEPEDFVSFIHVCDSAYLAELEYKPRIISDIHSPLVDPRQLYYICRNCGRPARRMTEWRFASRGFQAEFLCAACSVHVKALVSFKKMYSSVDIKRSAREIPPDEEAPCVAEQSQ